MASKQKQTAKIVSIDQLRVLASPVAIEIIQAIRTGGAATVAELGPRIGRKANSLHYHVRKLSGAGLIREAATRMSGARIQSVYDVTADVLIHESAPKNAKRRKHVNDIVASMLRLATRSFVRAPKVAAQICEAGPRRNLLADRYKARLTRPQLAKVNTHLQALQEIFASNTGSQRGELYTLTMVLAPEADVGA